MTDEEIEGASAEEETADDEVIEGASAEEETADDEVIEGASAEEETVPQRRTGDLIQELDKEILREDAVEFSPGDTVRVLYNVREGSKERIQAFEGVCIGRRGAGAGETFTVRKISSGIGVERVFPLHAPTVTAIEVVRRGKVRRAKLYYLRNRRGKSARIKEKRVR